MTPALSIASAPTDGRTSGSRDSASGRSGQGDASSFEGVLADVGDGSLAAGAQTASASTGVVSSLSSFRQLLNGGLVSDGDASSGKSGSSKGDKDDAAIESTPTADPTALGASVAMMAALQSASTQGAAAGAATLSPTKQTAASSGVAAPSARATTAGDEADITTGAAGSTGVSVVKVETHLATNAPPAAGAPPDKNESEADAKSAIGSPQPGTGAGEKAATEPTSAHTDAAPTSSPTTDGAGLATPSVPIQTIAKAVTTLAAATPANVPADPAPTPAAPPRTMTIQLTPANLGTVSVTMHLIGQSLDLQLAVSDPNTLGALSRDRDSLSQAVQGTGYDLRTLVIQGTDASSTMSSNGNSSGGDTSNHQMQSRSDGQASQSGTGAGGNGNDRREQQSRGNSSNEASRTSVSARAGTGGLFV